MIARLLAWIESPGPVRLSMCISVLVGVVTLVTLLVGWGVSLRHGEIGWWAAGVAGGACGAGGLAALVLAGRLRHPQAALINLVGGMFFRMGIPFAVGFYFQQRNDDLARAGVFGLIVLIYMPTLFTEVLLSLRLMRASGQVGKSTGVGSAADSQRSQSN